MKFHQNNYIVILVFTLIISCSTSRTMTIGQNKIIGIYKDQFSDKIELKVDSTFVHNYSFDLSSSWTTGKWRIKNDTIYLKTKLILDTLSIRNSENEIIRDSLVLSEDTKVERIESIQFISSMLSSGGQNRKQPPKKLFWKNKKLYLIKNDGKLDLRKLDGFWTDDKYHTYFVKAEN